MKLLVAESDADLAEMLTGWLRTQGYQVRRAFSGDQIRAAWIEQQPDLVIVDAALKGADSLRLCRDLQSLHDALVLAVAREQDIETQIRCLEAGADAYLPKPFLPGQLMAHIHALSRRVRRTLMRNPATILAVGAIQVDIVRHEARVNGRVARLTPTQSKLLHLLAINVNDVCTHDQIVAHVWGSSERSDATLVKVHIHHLREKIERDPSQPQHIVTVAGSGYMLVRQPGQSDYSDYADQPSAIGTELATQDERVAIDETMAIDERVALDECVALDELAEPMPFNLSELVDPDLGDYQSAP